MELIAHSDPNPKPLEGEGHGLSLVTMIGCWGAVAVISGHPAHITTLSAGFLLGNASPFPWLVWVGW